MVELSLRKHCIADIQSRVLPNVGSVNVQLLQGPVVELSSNLKLESAKRVGDALKTIADWVSEVVKRVDAPFILGVGMGSVSDPVQHWISEGGVGMGGVNLGFQAILTFGVETQSHVLEHSEVVLNRSIPVF